MTEGFNNYRRNRDRGRAAHNSQRLDAAVFVRELLRRHNISASDPQAADFVRHMMLDSWQKYQEKRMDQRIIVKNIIERAPVVIPNATQGSNYDSGEFTLPAEGLEYEFEGAAELELMLTHLGNNRFRLVGKPAKAGDFTITVRCKYDGWLEGDALIERTIPFAVNANPREIMERSQKPTPRDVEYFKEDRVCEYLKVEAGPDGEPRKDIVAASNRGRSHGREGKPRDDHFRIYHSDSSDWYVMAVADGAGSAKFSRRGSQIACDTALEFCERKLADSAEFENLIRAYSDAGEEGEENARKNLGNAIYGIVGNAAFQAHKAIVDEARNTPNTVTKDFATTLLLAICKKFDFGWFIASFWVGDGAMCIYDEKSQTFRLLGVPDEGEYSGQTRFLTMPEIFADYTALYKRLRFNIADDFTALFLMTDGVSDPMFGTDANLNNIDRWNEFWAKLKTGFPEDGINGVDLSDDNEEAKNQLQRWLDFWMRGEHDDRTLAILY